MLKIKNLKKNYHNKKEEIQALKNFTYTVEKGKFIAIVGPSGCGKSTILSILANLENKSDGEIIISDAINIGYMLQQDCLLDFRTILDNALLGLELQNKLTENNIKYVTKLLETYGLKDFINSYPNSLSGGMRQRVALIRTLATKPDLLLLDEPFSALDYQTRLKVSDDVYNIIKKENKTVIMVTHDLAEAISLADEVIVLSNRPSYIKKVFEIKLENKSTPINNRKDKMFPIYYEKIWKEIDIYV